jgi:hypothetical protein
MVGAVDKQVFRSPAATAVWWVWVVFALGNLIDIAVQGRDRFSLVAAFVLIAVTGVMYAVAQRPRLVVNADGLTIVNPLREHRVGWTSVSGIDATELLRVRCEWPDGPGGEPGRKSIYAWAVSASRRRDLLAQARADRRSRPRRGPAAGGLFGEGLAGSAGFPGGSASPGGAAAPKIPAQGQADQVVTVLRARAEEARAAVEDAPAAAPASTWSWPAAAVAGIPLVALLAVLAV